MIYLVLLIALSKPVPSETYKVVAPMPSYAVCAEVRQLDPTGTIQCMTEAEIWALHIKVK